MDVLFKAIQNIKPKKVKTKKQLLEAQKKRKLAEKRKAKQEVINKKIEALENSIEDNFKVEKKYHSLDNNSSKIILTFYLRHISSQRLKSITDKTLQLKGKVKYDDENYYIFTFKLPLNWKKDAERIVKICSIFYKLLSLSKRIENIKNRERENS